MKTLRDYRIAAGFSQEALAKELNISVSTVRNWEQNKAYIGDSKWITVRYLMILLDVEYREFCAMVSDQMRAVYFREED